MRAFVLASLLLLSACSYFDARNDWERSGANDAITGSDLESCRQQARAMIDRDQRIDGDISSQNVPYDYLQSSGTLESNLSQFQQSNRYESIVEDCMAARGYGESDSDEDSEE
ncbi:MAG: hypothetical protein ACREUF_06470 [Solimonas sp.]